MCPLVVSCAAPVPVIEQSAPALVGTSVQHERTEAVVSEQKKQKRRNRREAEKRKKKKKKRKRKRRASSCRLVGDQRGTSGTVSSTGSFHGARATLGTIWPLLRAGRRCRWLRTQSPSWRRWPQGFFAQSEQTCCRLRVSSPCLTEQPFVPVSSDKCAHSNVPHEAGLGVLAVRYDTESGTGVGMVSARQESVACNTTKQAATLDAARLPCFGTHSGPGRTVRWAAVRRRRSRMRQRRTSISQSLLAELGLLGPRTSDTTSTAVKAVATTATKTVGEGRPPGIAKYCTTTAATDTAVAKSVGVGAARPPEVTKHSAMTESELAEFFLIFR